MQFVGEPADSPIRKRRSTYRDRLDGNESLTPISAAGNVGYEVGDRSAVARNGEELPLLDAAHDQTAVIAQFALAPECYRPD